MSITETAYKEAIKVLEDCIDPIGMKASAMMDGYHQVWARDSMITFLGASLIDSERFKSCFRTSIETLARFQHPRGMIPGGVDVITRSGGPGGADANLWFILGCRAYELAYGDTSLSEQYAENIRRAVANLRYHDFNADGLLEIHEAQDWADLVSHMGHVLYDNVLYVGALRVASMLPLLRDTLVPEPPPHTERVGFGIPPVTESVGISNPSGNLTGYGEG